MTLLGGVVIPGITNKGYVNSAALDVINVTADAADAMTVAQTGTDYIFQVDAATTDAVTGIKITGAAEGDDVAIEVISSGTNEAMTFNAKGSGAITIGGVSTGDVNVGSAASNYVNFARTGVADGTGSTATLLKAGGAGRPTSATQAGWLPIKVAGVASWLPYWQ
jgi:hypothetical protein